MPSQSDLAIRITATGGETAAAVLDGAVLRLVLRELYDASADCPGCMITNGEEIRRLPDDSPEWHAEADRAVAICGEWADRLKAARERAARVLGVPF